jgi:hypothetical protein
MNKKGEIIMENRRSVSSKTRNNWLLDASLFVGALVASLSGVYFLIFPDGGFKGGRNPYYGIQIIFDRTGWEWIHTWISMAMIAIAIVHLVFHWKWVVSTTKRVFRGFFVKKNPLTMSAGSWRNILVDGVLALGFLICAATGIFLFFTPETKGGINADPMFLFSRTVWDLLHTWSGVAFISAFLLHFVIHWGWVVKVGRKLFTGKTNPVLEAVLVETQQY